MGLDISPTRPLRKQKHAPNAMRHGWLMKGKSACLLPLLHRLVEERAGERRFPANPPPFMSQPWDRLRWKEEDLPGRRKGDKFQVRLARRLRRETTMKPEADREAAAHGKLDRCLQPAA